MLKTEKINNVIVVSFDNVTRFNALITEPVKEDLKSFFNKSNTKLILDLKGIEFIDSSGFGVFLSVLVAVEIADVNRFKDESKLHCYAGVIPSVHSSGDRTYYGRIIRDGNRWLRWAVVEAVWPAIRADFDLRVFYERRKRRKGANSAKVATARRFLTIIYRMLKENRPYIPYKRQ